MSSNSSSTIEQVDVAQGPAPSEALEVLSVEAEGRTGRVPHRLIAAHALRVTPGGDFPVQKAALDALLRRIKNAREADGFELLGSPRDGGLLGAHRLRALGSASAYRLVLRSVDPIEGSCECPDFLRGGLGACKHLLWLIDRAWSPRGSASARSASPLPPAVLQWNPVRPLTGPGDWLERVLWSPAQQRKAAAAIPIQEAALSRWFTGGGSLRSLRSAFAGDATRRLSLVRDLCAWVRAQRRGALVADPALRVLLEREEARLARQVEGAWSDKELSRHLGALKRKLFPYQAEGVRRFLEAERLLLADDMGLGKTAQAISACHALFRSGRIKKGLIVVPAPLKPQWLREWQSFTDVKVSLVDGTPAERARLYRSNRDGFLIVNYEQVIKDLPELVRFQPQLVVLDEAQRIKNWATKTAASVKRLSPRYRLVLTGTPLENRLDELASLMDWIDDLALEPKWRLAPWHSTFADGAHGVVGARNLDTLRSRLQPVALRRIRKEVLAQLPPRTDTRLPVAMTPEQRSAHDELLQPIAQLMQRAARRPLTQPEFLKLMSMLTQQRIICNGLAQRDFAQTWPVVERLGPPTPALLGGLFSPKLLELRELLTQLVVTQQRKVVIFSQWRRMLRLAEWASSDLLAAAGVRSVYFTGDEGQNRRTQNLVDLHDDPRTRVLFATDAGGVGLNLQRAASACIHLDLPWNPAVLEQRTGRIFRLGQTQPVQVYYLVAASGIEARIASVVGNKKALFDGLFDSGRDEVRFEGNGSFLATVERLLGPASVPDLEVPADPARPPATQLAPGHADDEAEADLESEAAVADVHDDAPAREDAAPPAVLAGGEPVARSEAGPPERSGDRALPAASPSPASAASPPAAAAPPGVGEVSALFSKIRVERTPDGRLTLEAPRESAEALAELLRGMAMLLAKVG